jgi:hypothetical protein
VILCTIPDDVLVSATSVGVVETVRRLCPEVVVIATAISFPEARAPWVQAARHGTLDQMGTETAAAAERAEVLA